MGKCSNAHTLPTATLCSSTINDTGQVLGNTPQSSKGFCSPSWTLHSPSKVQALPQAWTFGFLELGSQACTGIG